MKYIFISYINRSGSTLLANQISRINNVLVIPEGESIFYRYLLKSKKPFKNTKREKLILNKIIKNDLKIKRWGISIQDLDLINKKYYYEIFFEFLITYQKKHSPSAKFIVFKVDKIIQYFYLLSKLIPNDFYLIYVIRDCRAIFASQKSTFSRDKKTVMNKNPFHVKLLWKKYYAISNKIKNNSKFIMLKFEDFIKNTSEILNNLSKEIFNNEKISIEKGNLFQRIPEDLKHMHINIEKPPSKNHVKNWGNSISKSEISYLQMNLENIFNEYDYFLKPDKISKLQYKLLSVYHKTWYFWILLKYKIRVLYHRYITYLE